MKKTDRLSQKELIIFSIYSVLQKKEKCSYSDLIKESFSLFPEELALAEAPEWPDPLRLDRPLRKLREEGLIKGSPRTFYSLTEFGKQVAKKIKNEVFVKQKVVVHRKPTRSPALTTLSKIEKSEDFNQYIRKKVRFQPNNMRIRSLTGFTLETPKGTVISFLKYLSTVAKDYKRSRLADYLKKYVDYLNKE